MTETPHWLNMDPAEELRVESRVSVSGIAILLLQRHPDKRRSWLPVASWGRCLEAMERHDSRLLLELRALWEGCWKLAECTTFAQRLTMLVSPELRALLKIAAKAHPAIHA